MSAFLRPLGVEHPLVQAPMSGSNTPALVAAVSGAGGLGSLGAGYLEPQALLEQAAQIRAAIDRPFALNLFVLPDDFEVDEAQVDAARRRLDALMESEGLAVRTERPARWAPRFSDQLAALREARPAVASFAFGLLSTAQVRELQARNVRVVGTATSVAEARAWAERGADAICVQGAEAGGHRGTFLHAPEEALVGLFALLPLTVAAVDIPVFAAGGIMDGRGMVAAEVLGADASQLGTAFLACPESAAAEAWKRDLPQAADHRIGTIYSFSGRAARGLRNRYVAAMQPFAGELPPYPVLNALTAPLRRAAAAAGRGDLISEWCGQAAALVRPMPAAELVRMLMREYAAARCTPA
ncbi:NAD(P)H-dependent flavin oxidoreductase [Frateuria hangzhouensis]|uniref:NAD(P)H-dependent flavin oxidoreductase n=1 Tax=Frateuria hangzhouensis TaxID=2995589 RepID=UPI002260B4D5|nr:nitronate monooxygenase [Frateuria sp. STR12]MCX7514268.1 nitronate monooxygenase [Frateuria sp. STR12]